MNIYYHDSKNYGIHDCEHYYNNELLIYLYHDHKQRGIRLSSTVVMCNKNNFIYCLSRSLHTYLSRYDKLSRYMFHHCVKDVNIGDTCNNEVLNYNTA